ncbi:hypothetical protein C4K23_0582 [Pseudomonas chlororaphis]|nr:hypothetical protein C4K23_0582 [Pseudomonas chlororaphis]
MPPADLDVHKSAQDLCQSISPGAFPDCCGQYSTKSERRVLWRAQGCT